MTARPRTFALVRSVEVSGVSGTGRIADGVLWPDGTATVRWLGDWPTTQDHDRGIPGVEHIHGHGGVTRVVWDDAPDAHGLPTVGTATALPPDVAPPLVPRLLMLLGPARMVLDRCAEAPGRGDVEAAAAEAADMAQRIVDWIGHPVTDEPAWATRPCAAFRDATGPDGAAIEVPCGGCRPCLARVHAGAPATVDPTRDGPQ